MPLNLTNLFTALGRVGRTAYLIATGQVPQSVPFTELEGYAYINSAWVAQLAQSYDNLIRNQSQGMGAWQQVAQTILLQMVTADDPAYGTSLGYALQYLLQQMQSQGKTVNACTIGSSVTPDAANVGTGKCYVTTTRWDGQILQNTAAEVSTLFLTSDSYTGGATAGQESWLWQGAPNVSSLGTGVGVGPWDWDWPVGSGASANGTVISAAQDANTSGNLLTNSDFETFTLGSGFAPDNWFVQSGTWGVDFRQGSTSLSGSYSVEFIAGGAACGLTQKFNSSDTTGSAAGTSANVTAFTGYFGNLWLRAAGVVTGGTLTIDLVDGAGNVINNQQGTPNTGSVTLSTLAAGAWTNFNFGFQLPVILPTTGVFLRVRVNGLTGANVFWDDQTFTPPTNLYPAGPYLAVFAGATPFEAAPDPDAFTVTFTNDRAGATYCATFQTLINRLFGAADLILPYASPGNISDTLITGV